MFPDGTKSSNAVMLTYHQSCPETFTWGQFHTKCRSHEMPQSSITTMRLKIAYPKFHSNPTGAGKITTDLACNGCLWKPSMILEKNYRLHAVLCACDVSYMYASACIMKRLPCWNSRLLGWRTLQFPRHGGRTPDPPWQTSHHAAGRHTASHCSSHLQVPSVPLTGYKFTCDCVCDSGIFGFGQFLTYHI